MNFKKIIGTALTVGGFFLLIVALMGVNYKVTDFVGGWDSESLGKRLELNRAAVRMWLDHPIVGVGAGNFISELPNYITGSKLYWLQPVHNIFLLWLTETGIVGLMAAVWYGQEVWNVKLNKWMLLALVVIAVTGSVDHYLITLPQNMWLMAVLLAVI